MFLNDTAIEIIHPHRGSRPRVALLDFDGTLSLVRSGWRELMIDLCVELLLPLARDDDHATLATLAAHHVDRLTGRATIDQMAWLSDEVARRGGQAAQPEDYKREFAARLASLRERRLNLLWSGDLPPEALLVPGARALLEALRARDVLLVLASGTDRAAVLVEAAALQIDGFFGPHIYAPDPAHPTFTKRAVIDRMLRHEAIVGPELVAFGDGPVEIAETHAVGGVAVGVAFDEARGAGSDQRKRDTAIRCGADLVVTDFSEHARLLAYLFGD